VTKFIIGKKIMNKKTLIHSALQKCFKRSLIALPLMATVPFIANAEEVEKEVGAGRIFYLFLNVLRVMSV
jgi:hypothetical protein